MTEQIKDKKGKVIAEVASKEEKLLNEVKAEAKQLITNAENNIYIQKLILEATEEKLKSLK